jgi:uncharacterized protein YndB with AHSA1/START domain
MSAPGVTDEARSIVISRRFDAPRDLVFRAWTDPVHLERWWGPTGFSTKTSEFSMRAGGHWRHVMRGPDGTEYPNLSTYEEIVPPERIVYSLGTGLEGEPPIARVTVTFETQGGTTLLTMRLVFPTVEARDEVVRTRGAIEGGNQTLARLAEFLRQS